MGPGGSKIDVFGPFWSLFSKIFGLCLLTFFTRFLLDVIGLLLNFTQYTTQNTHNTHNNDDDGR